MGCIAFVQLQLPQKREKRGRGGGGGGGNWSPGDSGSGSGYECTWVIAVYYTYAYVVRSLVPRLPSVFI